MVDRFILSIASEYLKQGYLLNDHRLIQNVPAGLWAWSGTKLRMGFAKVEDHYLWLDGNNTAITPELLTTAYRQFSEIVNRRFHVPHALRITIPNLTVVAVSNDGFSEAVLSFARNKILNPWYGGEVGQVVLVELGNRNIVSLEELSVSGHPKPGAIALDYSAKFVRRICYTVFETQALE